MKYLVVFCDSQSWNMDAKIYDTYEIAYRFMSRLFNRGVVHRLKKDCGLDIDFNCTTFDDYTNYVGIKKNDSMMYAYIIKSKNFVRCEMFMININSTIIKDDKIDRYTNLTVSALNEMSKNDPLEQGINRFKRDSERNAYYKSNNMDILGTPQIITEGRLDTPEEIYIKEHKEKTDNDEPDNKKYPGKEKCEILRDIRKKIAEINGIKFEPAECHHKGPCLGTCPVCDEEIKYLDEQLQLKKERGEEVIFAGLAADEIKEVNPENEDETDDGEIRMGMRTPFEIQSEDSNNNNFDTDDGIISARGMIEPDDKWI